MQHLAQINIAHLLAPIDSPLLADFVADIDYINGIAEKSKGFVWRLKDDSGNATDINPFDNKQYIVNMSVWESLDDFKKFVYESGHVEVFKKRAKWFSKMNTPHAAMWWVSNGHVPTAQEGKEKLEFLAKNGDTIDSFSFKRIFEKPFL
jgi:heme-degrading monooxygenase HmoA